MTVRCIEGQVYVDCQVYIMRLQLKQCIPQYVFSFMTFPSLGQEFSPLNYC